MVALVTEELDLSGILASYQGEKGQPPYHPAMMLALLLYSYAVGIYSSRRIARACMERVDFMVIVALQAPGLRTVSEIRRRDLVARRCSINLGWNLSDEIDERAKSDFLGETSALLFPVNWPEAVAEQLANHRLWHWAMRRSCLCRQINEMDQRQDVDGVVVPELQVNDARRHSLLGRYLPIELLKPPINRDDRGSWS